MEELKVTIHGNRVSSYCCMVRCALRLKGVDYNFVEEDLINKSPTLIELNPVHKRVPVIVVSGKPIAESLVILEYIDETWKETRPRLLPDDPFLRARVRFWASFIHWKMVPTGYDIMLSAGEEHEQAAKEFVEHLETLEEGLKKDFPAGGSPFVQGDKPSLLDLIIGSLSTAFNVLGEIAGVELVVKERMPLLCSSIAAFINLDVVKDNIVPHDNLLQGMLAKREKALASARA